MPLRFLFCYHIHTVHYCLAMVLYLKIQGLATLLLWLTIPLCVCFASFNCLFFLMESSFFYSMKFINVRDLKLFNLTAFNECLRFEQELASYNILRLLLFLLKIVCFILLFLVFVLMFLWKKKSPPLAFLYLSAFIVFLQFL